MAYTVEDIKIIKGFMAKPVNDHEITPQEEEAIRKVCEIRNPRKMFPIQLAYEIYVKLVKLGQIK